MLILTIIPLLRAMIQCQHHEGILIDQLNSFFGFDHNIFFLDWSIDNHLDSGMDYPHSVNFIPQTVYVFDQNHNFHIMPWSVSGSTLLIDVVEPSQFSRDNSQVLERLKAMRMLHVNVKFGVLFIGNVTSMATIEQLFRWSWSVGIVNIFCAFYTSIDSSASPSFNVFRFDPFWTFPLVNLTGSESLQDYFPNKTPNYREHPFRMVLLSMMEVDLFELHFWLEIKRAFNASIDKIVLSLDDFQNYKVKADNYDFLMYESRHGVKKVLAYPHRRDFIVLFVPQAKQRSGITDYMQNEAWTYVFAFTLVTVTAASLFLTISRYLKTKRIRLMQSFVDVVNLLLNDNGTINYRRLNRADICVITPLTFFGLIVMNGILSVFQSYLTLPLYEHQIITIDELFQSSVPIIENKSPFWIDRSNEILEQVSRHGGWSDRIHRMDFEEEAEKFNNSVAFFLLDSQAQVYMEAQKQLNIKAYHLMTGITFEIFYSAFQVSDRFPFVDQMNEIVHRLQSGGLIEKWLKARNDKQIKYLRKINRRLDTDTTDSGSDDDSRALLTFLCFSWIGSAVLFVCEVIWNKIKMKITKVSIVGQSRQQPFC